MQGVENKPLAYIEISQLKVGGRKMYRVTMKLDETMFNVYVEANSLQEAIQKAKNGNEALEVVEVFN
jgi:hypothetical protein